MVVVVRVYCLLLTPLYLTVSPLYLIKCVVALSSPLLSESQTLAFLTDGQLWQLGCGIIKLALCKPQFPKYHVLIRPNFPDMPFLIYLEWSVGFSLEHSGRLIDWESDPMIFSNASFRNLKEMKLEIATCASLRQIWESSWCFYRNKWICLVHYCYFSRRLFLSDGVLSRGGGSLILLVLNNSVLGKDFILLVLELAFNFLDTFVVQASSLRTCLESHTSFCKLTAWREIRSYSARSFCSDFV
jgi:hypothetical protein